MSARACARNIRREKSARKIVQRFLPNVLDEINLSKIVRIRVNVAAVVVETLLMNVKVGQGENISRTEKSLR